MDRTICIELVGRKRKNKKKTVMERERWKNRTRGNQNRDSTRGQQ